MASMRERLNHLEEVSPRIGKESDAKPNRGCVVWLADNGDTAAFQFVDYLVDVFDLKTHMMPAGHPVAVVEVLVRRPVVRAGTGQKLEMETVVRGRVKKAERETGNGRGLPQSKVKILRVPCNGRIEVRHTNGGVIDLQGSKGAGSVGR